MAALVVLAMGASDVARVLHAASRAQTAADAAALAAAQALAIDQPGPEPAEIAAEYAARNEAVLETCACDRGTFEATVTVRLPVRDLFLVVGDRTVRAQARAQVDLPVP
jgi:Flp pilus assembly protein TadG